MNCVSPAHVVGYLLSPEWVGPTCRAFLGDRSLQAVFGVTASHYLWQLGLTLLLESVIYGAALRRRFPPRELALWILVLNLATHPLVVLGLPQFFALAEMPKIAAIVTGELFAPLLEGTVLWRLGKISPRRAYAVAFAANLFSWWLGAYM